MLWQTGLLPESLAEAFTPRSDATVSEWCADHVVHNEISSPPFPGPHRPERFPYCVDIENSFLDPTCEEHHTCKSTQAGVTEAHLDILRYNAGVTHLPAIYAIDSLKEVKQICRYRLQTTLPETSLTEDPNDLSALMIRLRHSLIYMLGSGSKGAWENKPAGLVILDEFELHQSKPGEPPPEKLAQQRMKAFRGRRKFYTLSKPGEETGRTWKAFLRGTQEKYFVPCPGCDHFQPLVFERFRFGHCKDLVGGGWDRARIRAELFYECEKGCPIAPVKRDGMVQRGEWRATNPDAQPGVRSKHIWDAYSPLVEWYEIVFDYLDCGNDPALHAAFRTGRLGLPREKVRGEVKEESILRLRRAYKRGTFPTRPALVTLKVDIQGDVQKYVVGGFEPNGDYWISNWGFTLAIDEIGETVGQTPLRCADTGELVLPDICLIDEGYKPTETREAAQRMSPLFRFGCFTSKGRGGIQVVKTVAESKVLVNGRECIVYHYDDDALKKELYLTRIARVAKLRERLEKNPDDLVAKAQLEGLPKIWFPEDVAPEFYDELLAESLRDEIDDRGYTVRKWHKESGRDNDFGDGAKMGLAIWKFCGHHFAAFAPAGMVGAVTATPPTAAAA